MSAPLTASHDPADAAREAAQHDLVQRKLDMDALRKRLSGSKSQSAKLRESCEGFESVFLQKIWEQMRKTVPKEGFLHSKDEEMYQSLFDVELCKKMSSAGGIGLADMLYEQLSQQLENTGRTTTPGSFRRALPIPPSSGLLPAQSGTAADKPGSEKLTAAELYEQIPAATDERGEENPPRSSSLETALNSLRLEVEGAAAREWAQARELATGSKGEMETPDAGLLREAAFGPADPKGEKSADLAPRAADERSIEASVRTGSVLSDPLPPLRQPAQPARADLAAATAENPLSQTRANPGQTAATLEPMRANPEQERASADPATLSWKGPGPVSANPRPISKFTRNRKSRSAAKNSPTPPTAGPNAGSGATAQNKGQVNAPQNTAPNTVMTPAAAAQNSPAPAQAAKPSAPAQAKTASAPAAPADAVAASVWPLDGPMLSRFGWTDDAGGRRRWNPGVEIAASAGSPVKAILPGTVVYSGPREGAGNTVVLEHKGGYRSYYGNLQPSKLRVGEQVKHGAEFAKIAAGPSSSPQGENSASLRFELKKGEMALNPESAIVRGTQQGTDT
ncbi:MAG: peptidoglycan DD-metalloendopeptidase family protein [Desulfovibrio sp.]|jgi:Rod binding domain-containing protein/biotin carboxyl carrier protein|nr:peptidoglycan DD-metalloendopeptidase family protein [Desulfovibrio sp.]